MMQKNPNPQGKGLTPLLSGLAAARPDKLLPPKQVEQVTNELFTSLFVLSARFEFKPICGKRYWLYLIDEEFRLFTIAPNAWSGRNPGLYIGECELQEDITWTVNIDEQVVNENWFNDLLSQTHKRITSELEQVEFLEDAMPYHVSKMPYYQRLLAYGLGVSLKASMQGAGINQLSYKQAAKLITVEKGNAGT